ncbi:hypothetical protein BH23ACT9_BH23ACT9_21680 [soil metagenome]
MDFTTVHIANSSAEADIVAGLLRSLGLEVIVGVESPYTEAPTVGGEGIVRIDVPLHQEDAARAALADAENTPPPA